jgi:hypothetical protein
MIVIHLMFFSSIHAFAIPKAVENAEDDCR